MIKYTRLGGSYDEVLGMLRHVLVNDDAVRVALAWEPRTHPLWTVPANRFMGLEKVGAGLEELRLRLWCGALRP
jgi:hypothetical protein